jgi:hypothetical protein
MAYVEEKLNKDVLIHSSSDKEDVENGKFNDNSIQKDSIQQDFHSSFEETINDSKKYLDFLSIDPSIFDY